MVLDSLREDPSEWHSITSDNIIATRDKTAEQIGENLPDPWKGGSMMSVRLYTKPLVTLEELMKE